MMSDLNLSFEAFTAACQRAPVVHCSGVGIVHAGRRFWSQRLARWVGKRGKPVRFFIDPTGPFGDSAIVFRATGEFLDNVPEVGRPQAAAGR